MNANFAFRCDNEIEQCRQTCYEMGVDILEEVTLKSCEYITYLIVQCSKTEFDSLIEVLNGQLKNGIGDIIYSVS